MRTIEIVPILWKERIEKEPRQLELYCREVLGLVNPDIRVRKILIQSLVKKDGFYMYLSGKTGTRFIMRNAVGLCLEQGWINYIKKLEKEEKNEEVTTEKNIELYKVLKEKHVEKIYKNRPNPVGEKLEKRQTEFEKLSVEEQGKVILALLNLTKIGTAEANLELIGESAHTGKMLISKNITDVKEFYLIHQSVTGIYEKQVDLLTV